jgi:hypothetical protein
MLITQVAYALECPSDFSPTDVAKELLRAEFSGIRHESMRDHKCLKQSNFPYNIIESDVSNDEVPKILGHAKDMKELLVIELKVINTATHTYKIAYQIKYNTKKNKGYYNVSKDSMTFFIYKDKKNQSIYGCGGVIENPKNYILFQQCIAKN